jgi:hypothetical protein
MYMPLPLGEGNTLISAPSSQGPTPTRHQVVSLSIPVLRDVKVTVSVSFPDIHRTCHYQNVLHASDYYKQQTVIQYQRASRGLIFIMFDSYFWFLRRHLHAAKVEGNHFVTLGRNYLHGVRSFYTNNCGLLTQDVF